MVQNVIHQRVIVHAPMAGQVLIVLNVHVLIIFLVRNVIKLVNVTLGILNCVIHGLANVNVILVGQVAYVIDPVHF